MSSDARLLTSEGKTTETTLRSAIAAPLLYALATILVALLLSRFWQHVDALHWIILSILTLVAILWRLFRFLPENVHPSTQAAYPSLGLANHISLLRGVLLAWLAGFLFAPRPEDWPGWLPAVLYTTAIMLDGLDGLAARLTRQVSKLGQRLDIELDGLGILVASLLGIGWGQLPLWYGLVGLAYYAFTLGRWLRRRLGLALYPLSPSILRRVMAGTQMGFLSAVLWPVFPATLTAVAASVVAIPFLVGFTRDWLVVSGQLDVKSRRYQVWSAHLGMLVEHWMPIPFRLAVAAVFALHFLTTGNLALFAGQSLPSIIWLSVLGMLILAGAAGRIAGVLLAIFVGLAAAPGEITLSSHVLIGCGLALLQLGSGRGSIWPLEEKLLRARGGGDR